MDGLRFDKYLFCEGTGTEVSFVGCELSGVGICVRAGARARLHDCTVRNAPDNGLNVSGEGCFIEFEGGSVTDSRGCGVHIGAGARAVLRDLTIANSAGAGLYCNGSSVCDGERVTIHGSGPDAVLVCDEASVKLRSSHLHITGGDGDNAYSSTSSGTSSGQS